MYLPSRQKVFYFCDESSHHAGDEFMAVGGIAVNLNSLGEIERQIIALKSSLSLMGEIKWSNTKNRRDSGQKAYADLLRELVEAKKIHFHIRFQRTDEYDHKLSGSRRKIDTVSKAYYQLLTHRPVTFYGDSSDLHIRPDSGECTELLPKYQGHLNSECKRIHKCQSVKSIHPTNSKNSDMLQLLDVTLGALTCLKNQRHLSGKLASPKIELADHIHALWGRHDLDKSHVRTSRKFNVWNVKPTMKKGRGP